MLLAIAFLVGIVIFIIAYLLINHFTQADLVISDRIKRLNANNSEPLDEYWENKLDKSLKERLLGPVIAIFGMNIKRITPAVVYAKLEREVEQCGNFQGRGMNGLLTYIVGVTLAMLALAFLYISTKNVSFFRAVVLLIGAIGVGIGFPILVVKLMIGERQEAIRLAMPDVLDLLCVSVEAGMGFDGAMGKVTSKMKGPLIEECERYQQELRVGVTRRNALLRLSDRCGIKEMQLFVAALIQAEKLGVGLAQVLEVQSENMRELRRQNARAMAAKLPTKILFPTLIFIFPVIFVVALGPPVVTIINSFIK